jgi:predicted transcriptional regulator/rubrerythrin
MKGEERLIPMIRAGVAEKLAADHFKVKQIAVALNVTPAAVTQYLKRRRGANLFSVEPIDHLIVPLAEKAAKRVRSGAGGITTVELLETARQVMVVSAGRKLVSHEQEGAESGGSLDLLRERLQLELSAAENYLELANRTSDDHTKLLLRLIASDSIRHADIVSQVISWLEARSGKGFELPGEDLLKSMLALEDSAKEANLRESVRVDHPIARLLLEWIDMDEAKHGKMVSRMLGMGRTPGGSHRLHAQGEAKPL